MQKTELKFVRIWDHGVEHPYVLLLLIPLS
jgi:hypothetical protein